MSGIDIKFRIMADSKALVNFWSQKADISVVVEDLGYDSPRRSERDGAQEEGKEILGRQKLEFTVSLPSVIFIEDHRSNLILDL